MAGKWERGTLQVVRRMVWACRLDFTHPSRTSHLAVPATAAQEAKEMKLASHLSASSFTQLSSLANIFLMTLLCCLLVSHFDI